jgi:hypothetical protein
MIGLAFAVVEKFPLGNARPTMAADRMNALISFIMVHLDRGCYRFPTSFNARITISSPLDST